MQVVYLQLLFSAKLLSGLFCTGTMVLDPYEPVGCFNDKNDPRALPKFVRQYPVNETYLANSLASIVQKCAAKVYKAGFWYFWRGIPPRVLEWSER